MGEVKKTGPAYAIGFGYTYDASYDDTKPTNPHRNG